MAGSKSVPYCDEVYKLAKALSAAIERGARLEERVHELEALCVAKDALIDHLQSSVRFNSARYSEGGSGDFINNSRFEPAEETDNAA